MPAIYSEGSAWFLRECYQARLVVPGLVEGGENGRSTIEIVVNRPHGDEEKIS
jgi:hypothetical protein